MRNDNLENNDCICTNQYWVDGGDHRIRTDVLLLNPPVSCPTGSSPLGSSHVGDATASTTAGSGTFPDKEEAGTHLGWIYGLNGKADLHLHVVEHFAVVVSA